jgi:cell wall-associated NlpC family hydrolase
MTLTGMDIVTKAREYLGTRFHHQARLKGKAIDCVGLFLGIARELGLFDYDNPCYSRRPDGVTLMREFRKLEDRGWIREVPLDQAQDGDVLVFWYSRQSKYPTHVGIKSPLGFIHTYAHVRRVVETPIGEWAEKVVHAFRYRGVA